MLTEHILEIGAEEAQVTPQFGEHSVHVQGDGQHAIVGGGTTLHNILDKQGKKITNSNDAYLEVHMNCVKRLGSKKNGYVPGSEVALGSERHILPDKQGKEINNKKAFLGANDVLVVLTFWPNLLDIVKVDCDNESEEKEVNGSESTLICLGADKVAHVLGGDKVDVFVVLTLFWHNLLIHHHHWDILI